MSADRNEVSGDVDVDDQALDNMILLVLNVPGEDLGIKDLLGMGWRGAAEKKARK